MSEQKITGIDLVKTNFYLFSINAHGKPAGKIKLSRNLLLNSGGHTVVHYLPRIDCVTGKMGSIWI